MNKKISIVTPTFNEQENIEKLSSEISIEMKKYNYDYEHIIIDNNSDDNTIPLIKKIAEKDRKITELKIFFYLVLYFHTLIV